MMKNIFMIGNYSTYRIMMFLLMVVRLQGILSKRLKISRKGELSWKFSHLNLIHII